MNCHAVDELVASAVVAILFCPLLDPRRWPDYPDPLACSLALLLELASIAGVAHALGTLFT